jgi:hypothetical protein
MAISYVGGTSNSAVNGGDVDLTLPAMVQNDLVIVAYHENGFGGGGPNIDLDMAMVTAGYTQVADLFISTSYYMNFGVFYKFMGASPDATAVVDGHGGAVDGVAAAAQVFRGVKLVADGGPFDVAATTAAVGGTMHPNPPSINPGNAGACLVCAIGSGHSQGAQAYTFPAGYTDNAQQATADDTTDSSAGLAHRLSGWSDPEDLGTIFLGGTDNSAYAWGACMMALAPASTGQLHINTMLIGF